MLRGSMVWNWTAWKFKLASILRQGKNWKDKVIIILCILNWLITERLVETAASAYERIAGEEEDQDGDGSQGASVDGLGTICREGGVDLTGSSSQHGTASCTCPELAQIQCRLESKDLWDRFHDLGTEMIITKSGRYDIKRHSALSILFGQWSPPIIIRLQRHMGLLEQEACRFIHLPYTTY